MRGAKPCPACSFLLRYADPPGDSLDAPRFVAVQLLAWLALALVLAWLWAPSGGGELYAFLAFAALVAWLGLRGRARERGEAHLARRQYHCARCGRRYTGAELKGEGD